MLCLLFFSVSVNVSAQSYLTREQLVDSLSKTLITNSLQQDSLRRIIMDQRSAIDSIRREHERVSEALKNLNSELSQANGDRLQSSHTKSVLFIFNVIVGFFLLIALVWVFMRKKQDVHSSVFSNTTENWREEEPLDNKLERIEKLGSLRDKGLLTEDEFNLQKRQILGDRG